MTNENAGMEIAKTIIAQMGGMGKIKAMTGATNFVSTNKGVMFSFKGSKVANKVDISLTPLDLYDVKFYKINMKNLEKSIIPVEEIEGVYNDMLVEIFEKTTGLYLHF